MYITGMSSFSFFIMQTVSYRLIATFFSVSSAWSSCPTAAGFVRHHLMTKFYLQTVIQTVSIRLPFL